MKAEFIRWIAFMTLGVIAGMVTFSVFDITRAEWMDFKATFLIPVAVVGAVLCWISLWWARRR